MPWHKVKNHSECPASKPVAVVKDADGTVAGCHASESSANRQLAALYASEEADVTVVELGGKPNPGTPKDRRLEENSKRRRKKTTYETNDGDCPEGEHMMPDGECMPDDEMPVMPSRKMATDTGLVGPLLRWEGVLAVEGVETGDGREFAVDSLEWPDLEEVVLPLMWQERSEPQHAKSVVVGRIESIERLESGQIWGEGSILADSPVTEQIRNGIAGGVSVDVDSVKNADVEMVFGDGDEVAKNDDVITLLGPPPDKIVFHRGRLRGATLVALPAFVEACIHLVDDEEDQLVAAGVPVDPPAEWFEDPRFDGPTPWRVDESGRVSGHLCLWSTCHTTFQDRCVTPPREGDYPYFMRGELKTGTGELLGVGPITLGTGHASLRLGARPAAEHYDNTGTAAVDVRVGEDRYGIWVAGALRPEITGARLRELRGAVLSGDWRRIGGRLRLVAILAVNVPGFPVPRMTAQVQSGDADWSAMVAAGVVTTDRAEHVREALVSLDEDGTIRVRRAVTIGRDT